MKASLNLGELAASVGDPVVKTPVFGLIFLTSILKLPDHSHSLIQWIWSPLEGWDSKEPCLHSSWDDTQYLFLFPPASKSQKVKP